MSERKTLTREELYERVWKEPMTKLAKEFGLSDRGLAKICERNGIPVPPRGSWARKTASQQVKRPPLLAIKGSGDQTIVISAHWPPRGGPDATSATEETADPFQTLMEQELQDAKPLPVSETLRSPHRIVERWLKDAEDDAKRWRASGINLGGGTRYGSPLEKRRLRILSALFRALEERGFVLEPDKYRLTEISARFGQDTVEFTLTERIRQQRRRLTEAEKTARRSYDDEKAQTVQFDVRLKTFAREGEGYVLFLKLAGAKVETFWLVAARDLPNVARETSTNLTIVPSTKITSKDRLAPYRMASMHEVAARLLEPRQG
jgi:hypothetical protein